MAGLGVGVQGVWALERSRRCVGSKGCGGG